MTVSGGSIEILAEISPKIELLRIVNLLYENLPARNLITKTSELENPMIKAFIPSPLKGLCRKND